MRKNRIAMMINFSIIFVLVLLISLVLFRGNITHGMEFDEVYRTNNLIPHLNSNATPYNQSIYDLKVLGHNIPLMYKQYISSVSIIEYLPIGLFKDYKTGIRLLYIIYFMIAAIGIFIIVSKYSLKYAYFLTLMIITSPILYPDITFGFLNIDHVFLFALSIYLFYEYFKDDRNLWQLFFASFLFFFAANLAFYEIWVIFASILASLIFYFNYWKKFFSTFKQRLVICSGAFLGLFNYIAYNVSSGFPTVQPFIEKIFFMSEYNKHPIDYHKTMPLFDDIVLKIKVLMGFLGNYFYIYMAIFIIVICAYVIFLYKIMKAKRFHEFKPYYFPVSIFLLILIFILISPNAYRREHYSYLIPLFEITFLGLLILADKLFNTKYFKILAILFPLLLISLNFYASNMMISAYNETHGTGYYSPAIFDLNKYIKEKNIPSEKIVHIQWGMYSQLYFLNKGEYNINSIVFQLLGSPDDKDKYEELKKYFCSDSMKDTDKLYFPIYSDRAKEISTPFFNFVKSFGGVLSVEKIFYEKDGSTVFTLYKLENVPDFIKKINNRT